MLDLNVNYLFSINVCYSALASVRGTWMRFKPPPRACWEKNLLRSIMMQFPKASMGKEEDSFFSLRE